MNFKGSWGELGGGEREERVWKWCKYITRVWIFLLRRKDAGRNAR